MINWLKYKKILEKPLGKTKRYATINSGWSGLWNSNFVYAVCRGADVGDDYGLGAEMKYHGSFGVDNSWQPLDISFYMGFNLLYRTQNIGQ